MNFENDCGSVSNEETQADNGILSGAIGAVPAGRPSRYDSNRCTSHLGHCTNCAHAVSIIGYFPPGSFYQLLNIAAIPIKEEKRTKTTTCESVHAGAIKNKRIMIEKFRNSHVTYSPRAPLEKEHEKTEEGSS